METREAIYARRSVRLYQDKPVSDEDLKEILEAGMWAPSGVNLQPWYFVVIRSREEMERLYAIMGQISEAILPNLKTRFAKHPEVVKETTQFVRNLGGAPVCILAFQLRSEYDKKADTITQSVAAAIENILLAATDKGIGSCWLTAPLEAEMGENLRETFAPEKGPLMAMITLGYAAYEPKTPLRKKGRYIIV